MSAHNRIPSPFARTIAVAVVAAPVAVLVGTVLNPAIGGTAQANLTANATAGPADAVHVAAFVAATFLLPLNALGLAWLGYRAAPRLAGWGGLLGLLSWMPFAALTAQDDLTRQFAHQPDPLRYADLWLRFTTDPVMTTDLAVYAAGHLIAYTLLGIALLRTRSVPAWAAWAIIATNPVQVIAFVVHPATRALLAIAVLALAAGCVPAAVALLRRRTSIVD